MSGISLISGDQNSYSDNISSTDEMTTTTSEGQGVRQEVPPAKKQKKEPLETYIHFRITGSKTKGNDDFFEFMDCTPWIPEFGYQLEKGKRNGIEHYQGTFKCEPRKRISQLEAWFKTKFPTVDFPEKDYCRKSKSEASNRYGMKQETRIAGPWYKGAIFEELAKELVYKIEIELRPWQQRIVDIIKEPANDRDIWSFWEPKGGLGKTTFQKWLFQNFKGVIPLSGKVADMKNAIIEYMDINDGKVPKVILINLCKSTKIDKLSYEGIEAIKDMFFYSGKYKGGVVCDRCPHVMMFGNKEADISKLNPDRWYVIRLPDGKGKREAPIIETWEE